MLEIEQKFNSQINFKDKIAVAVSGGADSMALAILAKKWADTNNESIIAITVDHGLRPESSEEAKKVTKWMNYLSIEHHTLKWANNKTTSNIQSNARNARYEMLTKFCKKQQTKHLLVAHHKNDQAENVLLRIIRGSGIDGISSIEQQTVNNEINIIRPLLGVTKNQIISFLKTQNQKWIEDPSNYDDKYTRAWVRKFISKYKEPELLVERLTKTAHNMSLSRSYIEQKVKEEFDKSVHIKAQGYAIIKIDKFKNLHKESAYRIITKVIKIIGGKYYKPRFEKIKNIYNHLINPEGFKRCTLGGCIFHYYQNNYIVYRELLSISQLCNIETCTELLWDNRFSCNVGNISHDNLSIRALGKKDYQLISKEKKMIAKSDIPKEVIYTVPAIYSLEKIIAAPHINYYIEDYLRDKVKISFNNIT